MSGLWDAIKRFVIDFLTALKDLLLDVFVLIFGLIVDLLIYVFSTLPMPTELLANAATDHLSPEIGYFLGVTNFGNCLAVLGAAYLFRIIRRFVTLGIW